MRWALAVLTLLSSLAIGCDTEERQSIPEFAADPVALRAKDMRGANEEPPGDPKAKGFVGVDLNLEEGEVCIEYGTDLSQEPTAMHIHEGKAGQSGDPVVDLPLDGGCVDAEPDLLQDIADRPSAYYVNIHTAKYPDGAIRAQLEPE